MNDSAALVMEPLIIDFPLIGSLSISQSLLTTWGVMVFLMLASRFIAYKLKQPDNPWRTFAETVYVMMENAVKEVVPNYSPAYGSFW